MRSAIVANQDNLESVLVEQKLGTLFQDLFDF